MRRAEGGRPRHPYPDARDPAAFGIGLHRPVPWSGLVIRCSARTQKDAHAAEGGASCPRRGTLEPELLVKLARRNGIALPSTDPDELRAGYRFTSLQSFLDLYYRNVAVLRTEADFRELAAAYLARAAADGVRRAEIF